MVKDDKPSAIVGVDPGGSGAVCLLPLDGSAPHFLDMPDDENLRDIVWFYNEMVEQFDIKLVVLEKVWGIPNQSAKANFRLGFYTGVWKMYQNFFDAPLTDVPPATWQKVTGQRAVKHRDSKVRTVTVCDELYPNSAIRGPKGGLLDGRADALLLAHYGKLTMEGN